MVHLLDPSLSRQPSTAATEPRNLKDVMSQSTIYKRHQARVLKNIGKTEDPRPKVVRVLAGLPGFRSLMEEYQAPTTAQSPTTKRRIMRSTTSGGCWSLACFMVTLVAASGTSRSANNANALSPVEIQGYKLFDSPDTCISLKQNKEPRRSICLTAGLFFIRGGHDFDCNEGLLGNSLDGESSDDGVYDDEGDDYDEEDINEAGADDATAMHQQRRNLQRNQDSSSYNNENPNNNNAQQQQQPGRRPAPYIPRKKKKKNLVTRIAKSSLSFSKKAVGTTVKSSGKAAFYLMRPKSIQESEIWGVWRLDQQVGMKQATANIELTKRGFVVVRGAGGEEVIWKGPFHFVSPTWPKMPRVEFEARAFQPNPKGKPRVLFFKGYLERKVADKSVIKMVGKLYEIERPKGVFGKDLPVRLNKVGSFVGRRRIVMADDEEDEYDDEDSDEFASDGEGEDQGEGEDRDREGDYADEDDEDL